MRSTPTPPDTPAQPLRAGLRMLTPLWCMLLLLALAAGAVTLTGRWLLNTQDGGRWLLGHIPGLQVQGFTGTLLGERWQADKVRVQWATGKQWVEVQQAQAQGLRWLWRPRADVWLGLQAQSVVAQKVQLHTGPGSGRYPVPLPASIAPPLQLQFAQVRVAELLIEGLSPIKDATLDAVLLDARAGADFSVERFSFDAWGVVASGNYRMANVAPLALTGHASVRPKSENAAEGDAPRWGAIVDASGSVADLKVTGLLRGRPLPGRDAPALDVSAGLLPLQRWWLQALKLQTQALDLSSLSPQAPQTQLSGRAEMTSLVADKPLAAHIELLNAAPGRWDEKKLPLQRLALQVGGELQKRDRLVVQGLDLVFADSKGAAGRVTGSAVWQGHDLLLDIALNQLAPQRLDTRAPAVTLSGPLQTRLHGLPSPDHNSAGATPAFSADWKLDLQGQFEGRAQPVQIQMQASTDAQRLQVTSARAQAGGAVAELQGTLSRVLPATATGPWRLETKGQVQNFDPQAWWPGDVNSAWRQGPHRLSGQWQFDVQLPAEAAQVAPLTTLQRLAGNGTLKLADSVLAGVPLAADVVLAQAPSQGGNRGATDLAVRTVNATVRLAGNELQVEGRAEPTGSGDNDRWRMELKAEALAALAPLARLHPALAEWLPRQGSASATLSADGRWPRLRSEGKAALSQLEVGALRIAKGQVNWQLDTRTDQPLGMQLELSGVQVGSQRADKLRADLRGTLADHHIDITGALPVAPPAPLVRTLGLSTQSGTRADVQAQGSWRADAAGGGTWKARIERLQLGAWDGGVAQSVSASAPTSPATWVDASNIDATLQFDPQGEWLALQAEPGSLRLAQTLVLRWGQVRGTRQPGQSTSQMNLQLNADVEPFAFAPLLARYQPTMGWQGDLRLAARLNINAGEKMDAELMFERQDGDLQIVSEEGTQALGLTDFKFKLSAHDGLWRFTQSFQGKSLGDMAGEARVQSMPQKRWPAPDSPVEGQLQARVADIGIWGTWVPPGWRLTGQVRTTATVSGNFGDPQFTGELSGSGLGVRNPLVGVNVRDGQLAVKLNGSSAQIETFTVKAGDGQIEFFGGVNLVTWPPEVLLHARAERFRVLGRVDQQLAVSGNAALIFNSEQVKIEGKLAVDEGLFDASQRGAPSLDDDVVVRRPGEVAEANNDIVTPKVNRNWAMAVDIDAGQKLRLRGYGADTLLRGQLRLTTPGGRLAVNGAINTEGGTYIGYGQKLEIERGVATFAGPYNNPRLDLLALRPNIDMRVGVAIAGTALTPRVRLFSEPEMNQSDKLSWLILGRAPDNLGRNDTALLQRAAIALLGGEGEAPTDKLLKSLGIDDFSVRQGDTTARETVVSIGKQLSRRVYLGYERGVNATTGTWLLTYRIAQRFTLRLQGGLDNAADVIWTSHFQETPKESPQERAAPEPAEIPVRKSPVTPP